MKNFNLLIILLVFLAACQSNSTSYKVSGTISGLDSGIVYLVKAQAGNALTVDTAKLEDGQFSFSGEALKPELHYLRLNERDYFAQFFLENKKIEVEAYKDSLRSSVVTGSSETDIFNIYLDELEILSNQFRGFQEEYSKAMQTGNQDEIDRIKIDLEATKENMKVFSKNFVKENSTSVVAPFIVLSQLTQQLQYEDLKELMDLFPVELNESIYMDELKKIVDKMATSSIGAEAPGFTMNDTEGNPVSLSSFRGKYLLIDFWASWCGPCRQENPNVVKIYNQYKDKGFEILGVSLDKDKAAWLKAIEDDKLTWKHVSDLKFRQNEVARLYGVSSIPHTILLDPEGKIAGKNLRGKQLEDKLKELLQ